MGRILYFQWHSFMNARMERALQKLEIAYDTFFYTFTDWEKDEEFCCRFEKKLISEKYEKVLSVNYSPLISRVCEDHQVPYISWVYDCPIHIREHETLYNSCNTIYFFDRMQAETYQKQGINARHLPLAVDSEVFRTVYMTPVSVEEQRKYNTEIALGREALSDRIPVLSAAADGISERLSGGHYCRAVESIWRLPDTGTGDGGAFVGSEPLLCKGKW